MLLLNGESEYHENPVFVTDGEGTLTVGERTEKIEPGKPLAASEFFGENPDFLKIALEDENGRIYFSDGAGAHASLGYRGTMEIRKYQEGYGVVNELSLEQYLYGVVPSEMPSSYEREALCVQAVCARSYACIQLMKGDYAAYWPPPAPGQPGSLFPSLSGPKPLPAIGNRRCRCHKK